MTFLKENTPAPDFELLDQNNSTVKLSSYRGQPVVLYFYPKDDTPGCTTEACGFRDMYAEYTSKGVKVIGISPDDVKKHTKFIAKFDLPFTLLADTEKQVCEAYGVWGLKKMMGREYMGVFRTTFVIDSDGNIMKVFNNVKPENHAKEILSLFED